MDVVSQDSDRDRREQQRSDRAAVRDALAKVSFESTRSPFILTSATISSAMACTCAARDTPVVSFNRYVPRLHIQAVSSDNIAGARQVADFLVTAGHERLAFIATQSDATTNRDRRTGFVSHLKELGMRSYSQEEGGDFSYEARYTATKRLLRRTTRPDVRRAPARTGKVLRG